MTTSPTALQIYALALLLSWSYWLALGLAGSLPFAHLPGLLGPALAALLHSAWRHGTGPTASLLRRSLWPQRWSDVGWGLSVLALAGLAWVLTGNSGRETLGLPAQLAAYPGLPPGLSLALALPLVWLMNGLGEEIGWRGALQPLLQQAHGRFGGTGRLALLWAFWHLPLFWVHPPFRAMLGWPVLGWLFSLGCGAFVLAWLLDRTRGSIWALATWHTLFNFCVATPAGDAPAGWLLNAAVMLWGLTVAAVLFRRPAARA